MLKASVEGSAREGTEPVNDAIDRVAKNGSAAVLYLLAMGALYKFTNKYTPLLLVIFGAVAGQFIFVDDVI